MPKIQFKCPFCKKESEEKSHFVVGKKRFISLTCGHTYSQDQIEVIAVEEDKITLYDNRVLYPFQYDGVRFSEKSNFRCLISDEMGLGKTIQAVGSIHLHYEELKPILVIVKSSLTFQWMREIISGTGKPLVQILSTKDNPLPGFGIYITSFDSLPPRKKRNSDTEYTDGLLPKLKKLGIKTLVIDECQMLKNHSAARTNAVREIAKTINGDGEPVVKHIIALSGTPIKNNALEYFPILNLLHPEMFPNRDRFESTWVDHYSDGNNWKLGGLKDPEMFFDKTKDFIIRRTREEVLPDLPKIQRDFRFYPMSEEVMKAYGKKVKELADYMESDEFTGQSAFTAQTNLLAKLQILRHITGLAKIEPVLDYVEEFLENEPDGKLTIFHHHIDVGEILFRKLEELYPNKVIRMTANDDSSTRMNKIDDFTNRASIMIAPTLACGEGINLQFCNHAILMEREWNPANEEQAEGRFSRIGSISSSVLVNYPTATNTIDEFFAEIVERKREIVSQTLGDNPDKWDQSNIMRELAATVVQKWRMN